MDTSRSDGARLFGRRPDILLTVRVVIFTALLTVTDRPGGGLAWTFFLPTGVSALALVLAVAERMAGTERLRPLLRAVDLLALASFVFVLRDRTSDFYLICLYVLLIGASGQGLTMYLAAAAAAAAAQALAAVLDPHEAAGPTPPALIRTAFLAVCAVLLGLLAGESERERQAGLAARRELSTRIADLSGFLNDLLHGIQTGVLVVGSDGRITLCNRRASELLGMPADGAVDRPLAAFPWLSPLAAALTESESGLPRAESRGSGQIGAGPSAELGASRAEVAMALPDGRTMELGLGVSPVKAASGHPLGTCLVFQDITPLKEAQRRILQQERLAVAGRLAGGVAHEFGNLLGGLRTHAEYALGDGRPAELREALEIVARNIDRALLIVRNLLAFSRKSPPRAEPCDIARVLSDSLLLLDRDFALQKIAVERDLGPGLSVTGDPVQLQQAFLNLMINARQAMPGGGTLRVLAAREGGRVRVGISDTGPGIPPEVRARLFEPFFTTKTGEGGEPPGSGLGLAITRDLISAHGGDIEIGGEPGRGATFTLRFPAAS